MAESGSAETRETDPSRDLAPLIVLEGIDGSGKGTQANILAESLRKQGLRVGALSFPRYSETFFGQRVGDFLNGRFGALDEVDPFLASLLYAGDRFESRTCLQSERAQNDVMILDRFVASNVAHQAAKREGAERAQLRDWITHIEHTLFGLPTPDLSILLDVSVELSQEFINRKSARSYTDRKADIQESDTEYLQQVREAYLELAAQDDCWVTIPVTQDDRVLTIEQVADRVQTCVLSFLDRIATSSPA